MGRGRGRGKKMNANEEETSDGDNELVSSFGRRRGRPQKGAMNLKEEEDGVQDLIETEDGEQQQDVTKKLSVDIKKRKKQNHEPEISGAADLGVNDTSDSGFLGRSGVDGIQKISNNNDDNYVRRRRKSKPRRAAEAALECK